MRSLEIEKISLFDALAAFVAFCGHGSRDQPSVRSHEARLHPPRVSRRRHDDFLGDDSNLALVLYCALFELRHGTSDPVSGCVLPRPSAITHAQDGFPPSLSHAHAPVPPLPTQKFCVLAVLRLLNRSLPRTPTLFKVVCALFRAPVLAWLSSSVPDVRQEVVAFVGTWLRGTPGTIVAIPNPRRSFIL